MENSRKDLEWGEKMQEIAKYELSHLYQTEVEDNPGKDKYYDLYIPNKKVFIEVKADRKSVDTGNMVLEFASRGKLSGICTSLADYFMYIVYHKDYQTIGYYIDTKYDTLSNFLSLGVFLRGGDDNSSILMMLPIDIYPGIFRKFKHVGVDKLNSFLV
jgi:hypothetical protein